jgi:phosphohistidine phosphatase
MPLQRLILMRHAKAEERSPSGKDFDRVLTARGRAEAREMGLRLAEAGLHPTLALVSPAVRAVETWDEVRTAFPETWTEQVPALYHATPAAMIEAVEGREAPSVILVGHNPGLHALAFELISRGVSGPTLTRAVREGFPTAAAAAFRFEGEQVLCDAFLTPHDEDPA